jgi:hypothetical protein
MLLQRVPLSGASKSMAAKKKSSPRRRKKAAKRELIAPRGDKRYVRRDARGRIKESDDVGRSLSGDRRLRARKKAPKGQRDKGD